MDTNTPSLATRPRVLSSHTVRVPTALGTAYVTLAHDSEGQPLELFLNVGKAGTETFAAARATASTDLAGADRGNTSSAYPDA